MVKNYRRLEHVWRGHCKFLNCIMEFGTKPIEKSHKNWQTLVCQSMHKYVQESFGRETYALSFYRSQNVLCRSKFFQSAQKFYYIQCLFQNFCVGTKINYTECKSSFCLAQNILRPSKGQGITYYLKNYFSGVFQ